MMNAIIYRSASVGSGSLVVDGESVIIVSCPRCHERYSLPPPHRGSKPPQYHEPREYLPVKNVSRPADAVTEASVERGSMSVWLIDGPDRAYPRKLTHEHCRQSRKRAHEAHVKRRDVARRRDRNRKLSAQEALLELEAR